MSKVTELNTGEVRELYRELILDHARRPRHFGRLDRATHRADGINPLCGDRLTLYLEVDEQEVIRAVAFEGTGCAISVASASLMTDEVRGMDGRAAAARSREVVAAIQGKREATGLRKLGALLGVRDYPSRVKCATLAWHALCSAIEKDETPATTE